MGKKEGFIGNISDEMISKGISVLESKADDFIKLQEKNQAFRNQIEEKKFLTEKEFKERKLQMKQNAFSEQKAVIKSEFDRVSGMLKKTDPTTDQYRKLTDSLYNLKKLLTGWGGSDYDWD